MKKSINVIISSVITIVLLYFLLSKIKFEDVINILRNSSIQLLLFGFLFYILSLYIRTIRFNILLNSKVDIKSLFPITLFYNCANTVVPMRLGELSYVYLLKKTKKIRAAAGLSTLIISRVFDFLSIILILFMAIFLAKSVPKGLISLVPYVIFLLALLIFCTILFIFWQEPIVRIFDFFHNIFIKKQNSFPKRKFTELIDSFGEMKSKKRLVLSMVLSFVLNLLLIIYTIILAKGLGFSYSNNVMTVVTCLSILSAVIPISGINGFGTTETVWAILMSAIGYTINEGIILSLSLHIVQTIFMLFLGLVGWLGVKDSL